jgi:ATP-dependent helicase HrpB
LTSRSGLPVEAALPALREALRNRRSAVLVAPPGAGKTTRVPLALLDEDWTKGRKLIVLEPRRLAARAAATHMAHTLGERVGETVGYRMRLQSKAGPRTRVEFVTEGVFTRMVLGDPSLDGVAAVLFDEFHERSLHADLGLAFALDSQGALRDDLRVLAMSATLDGARVAKLLDDAPLVTSEGRAFPVETRYLGRDVNRRLEDEVADAVLKALREERGSLLVFLPGAREIRRTETVLRDKLRDPSIILAPLFGALESEVQEEAIQPAPAGKRKIVLATAIAETSLTIEGVGVVIDSGFARVPRYEPATGLTELRTVRVSQAAADQRRGRAGRVEPGLCYRLWDENATRALEPFQRPEILEADLAPLLLSLAEWGVDDPAKLRWLDPPPAPAVSEARELLQELDALDAEGRITKQGRALARLPLPPRLAHMVLAAAESGEGTLAADLAVVLTERGLGGNDVDLRHRLRMLRSDKSARAQDARKLAENWRRIAGGSSEPVDLERVGAILARAYPDRIAKSRDGRSGEFLLANGRGVALDPADALAREAFLAVAEIAGAAPRARILQAAPLGERDIESEFGSHIATETIVRFDSSTNSVRPRRVRRLGKLMLADDPITDVDPSAIAAALVDGIRTRGLDALPWTPALRQLRTRVAFLRTAEGEEWPNLSDTTLADTLDQWLGPFLASKRSLGDIGADDLGNALQSLLPYALKRRLEDEAPTHFEAPTGSRLPIDYGAEGGPKIAVRVQELFGLAKHPAIAGGRVPLTLELLSPAHRPVQVTRDLPGFWAGSYQAVKTEMRGRYPRHPWPDDPRAAPPTRRAKPRGT